MLQNTSPATLPALLQQFETLCRVLADDTRISEIVVATEGQFTTTARDAFVAFIDEYLPEIRMQIEREEEALGERFGNEYSRQHRQTLRDVV